MWLESVDGEDSSSQLNIGDHDAPEQNFLQSSFHQGPISAKFQSIEKWNVNFTPLSTTGTEKY